MEDAVRLMPKIDLHCHLDGSLTLESVRKITGRNVAPEELQADDRCRDLAEYLKKFDIPIACLKTAEALRIAARDFLLDAAKENICYIETRFAPLHSAGEGLNSRQAVESQLDSSSFSTWSGRVLSPLPSLTLPMLSTCSSRLPSR